MGTSPKNILLAFLLLNDGLVKPAFLFRLRKAIDRFFHLNDIPTIDDPLEVLAGTRADASKFQEMEEVVCIESGAKAFSVETDGGGFVGSQEIESDSPGGGEVGGGVFAPGAAAVFVEGYIKAPVELILHAPVPAHGSGERLYVGR